MKEKALKFIKPLFIIVSIIYALPSIIYYIENKTILNFNQYFKFLLNDSNRLEQAILYIIILAVLTILYILILKNRNKIFKNIKAMYIFIGICAVIFILVIPFTCSDVFYYLGVGRIDSTYGQNPYYVTITDFVESEDNIKYLEQDTILEQAYQNDWADTTVVYGPVWQLICKIVAGTSFGNIDIGLLIFKIIAVILHLLNCYLLYKITKKKLIVLLYGINPYILLEGIVSAHNDLYVITLVLSALYFLLKKKNIVISVLFLALATAIKYFTIILLPFIIIYHFRDKKPLQRLQKCFIYGLMFILILGVTYIMYVQDWTVLMGLVTQQERFAKSFYIIIMEYFSEIPNVVSTVHEILLSAFVIIYFFVCVTLLFKKNINFREEARKCEYFLIAFIFLLITNFQPWYLMWLFPLVIWQKSKITRLIIQILLISQFANSIFLINGEGWRNGTPFVFCMLLGTFLCMIINERRKEIKIGGSRG